MPRPADQPVPVSAWLAFVLACLFFLFEFVARVEPSLDAAGIKAHFGIVDGRFGLLASLFFWVYAPMQLVVGITLDKFGARRVMVPAVLICALGPLLFAASSSLALAGIGRILTGLGGAFAFVGALYVANHRFPARAFATLSGVLAAIGMVGTAVGVVWLTQLSQALGWRTVFTMTGLAGIGLFVVMALFFKGYRAAERAAEHPLAQLPGLFRSGRLWALAIVSALYYVPVNAYAGLWGSSELSHDRGLDPSRAEFDVSLIFWGLALGSIVAGLVSDRLSHRKWVVVAGAVSSALAFFAALWLPGLGPRQVAGLMFVAGFLGGPQVLTFAMAKEGLPNAVAGTAMAVVNMVSIGGAMLFQPLAGYLLDLTGGNYHLALIPVFAAPLVAGIMTIFIREYRRPEHRLRPASPGAGA